ncbi:hypothetical protein AX14_006805 [Amanita brunnescens Koide BX004]|nr:hypothetical protein AX14_006805 [Amanita brunnescens Koide BX004]
MSTEPGKDPNRVAAGLKAAVHNPRVSEEAKESATQRLHKMGEDVEPAEEETGTTRRRGSRSPRRQRHPEESSAQTMEGKAESRVMGGYKATLKNPRASEEAKEHAEEVLEQHHVAH